MADDTLRIRVDVETAPLGELRDALKAVNVEMKDAAQSAIPALRDEATQYSQKINELTGRHTGFTQSVREARTEARVFRFALVELIAGVDGMATAIGYFTGASDKGKESMKGFTTAAKDGLAAGLGLKFGLEALGVAGAGGIGIAVGAVVALATALASADEQAKKNAEEVDKLLTEYLKLENQLGRLTRAQNLNNLEADINIAQGKLRIEEAKIRNSIVAENTPEAQATKKRLEDAAIASSTVVLQLKTEIDQKQILYDDAEKVYSEQDKKAKKSQLKDEQDHTKELAEARQYLADFTTSLTVNAVDKQIAEENRLHDSRVKQFQQELVDLPELSAAVNAAIELEAARHLNKLKELRTPQAQGVSVAALGKEKTPQDVLGAWQLGIDVLNTGFSALSSTIHSGLAQAFGAANSMFQQFVLGVLDGITSIAEKLASSAIIAGIFSLFGGGFGALFSALTGGLHFAGGGMITEPVVGVGLHSGSSYSFGENAPERVSPLTSFGGGGGGYSKIEIVGTTKIDGRDLFQSWRETRIIDRKSGGNI